MAQRSLEECLADKNEVQQIEHEALFNVSVRINGDKHTISISEGITVLYDPQELEQNPSEYISQLRKQEESFLYAFRSVLEYASRDLKRIRAENRELISTPPSPLIIGLWRIGYLPFQLYTKRSLEDQLYHIHVKSFEDMIHDYAFMQSIFSEGKEMVENYLTTHEKQIPVEQREETVSCIIFAKKIADMYENLHGLTKLRRNERERWFYHYFPEERGSISPE